jgi:hypothetical protein
LRKLHAGEGEGAGMDRAGGSISIGTCAWCAGGGSVVAILSSDKFFITLARHPHCCRSSAALERATKSSTASFGPRTIEEVGDLIRANCANTQVVIFNEIDRDEERKPQVKSIPLIKSNHEFIYRDGKCYMKERTNYARTARILIRLTLPIIIQSTQLHFNNL